jgi:hypothetical protein
MMRAIRCISIPIALAASALWSSAASSQSLISGSTATWRLQNYVPNQIVLYFTGSPCTSGSLGLPSNAVQADQDRLWALILTSKATGSPVYIYYFNNGGVCTIASFGWDAG